MRITGGHYKNRKLIVPEGNDVRPTSDRMRQSLFNMLHHSGWASDFDFENARVLDLFCGSGALGLEALSHGAAHCIFIDVDIDIILHNSKSVIKDRAGELCDVKKGDATRVKFAREGRFNLVFLDPPYRKNLVEPTLENLLNQKCLADGALIVIEAEKEFQSNFDGLEICDTRTQGQSTLHILRYHAAIEKGE